MRLGPWMAPVPLIVLWLQHYVPLLTVWFDTPHHSEKKNCFLYKTKNTDQLKMQSFGTCPIMLKLYLSIINLNFILKFSLEYEL